MSSAPKSSARSASLRGRLLPAVRLGVHHCAHLRAVAEGVSIAESAARYLGIEHAASAPAAHRAAVDLAAAVARRRGDVRWRLLGLPLSPALVAPRSGSATPTLEEWAALKGYEDWSIAELQELYREQFPVDDTPDRRTSRNARLLRRRLRLIAELEASAAVRAQPEDLLAGWLSPALAEQLRQRGVFTLRQLQILIGIGGRWWTPLPGVGPLKARRLAALVAVLLPSPAPPVWRVPLPLQPRWRAATAPIAHPRLPAVNSTPMIAPPSPRGSRLEPARRPRNACTSAKPTASFSGSRSSADGRCRARSLWTAVPTWSFWRRCRKLGRAADALRGSRQAGHPLRVVFRSRANSRQSTSCPRSSPGSSKRATSRSIPGILCGRGWATIQPPQLPCSSVRGRSRQWPGKSSSTHWIRCT